jgi:hypothetical protein
MKSWAGSASADVKKLVERQFTNNQARTGVRPFNNLPHVRNVRTMVGMSFNDVRIYHLE